jgi:predicted transcriptional regulator of viral defense system
VTIRLIRHSSVGGSIVTLGPNSCPVLFRVPACCPFRLLDLYNPPRKLGEYAMSGPYKEAARRLLEIAQSQQGFFTTKQAIRAGFAEKVHAYHVNARNWIREHRGIYRLSDFRAAERPDLMLWYLWSQNRQEIPEGVYSHNTALSLHELSDLMPSKQHMTVPKDFRRSSAIPEILVLHRAHLEVKDIQEIHGVRVTRPLRTIVDLLRSGNVDRSQVKLAVEEAIRRGLIARREIDRLPHDKLQRSLQ